MARLVLTDVVVILDTVVLADVTAVTLNTDVIVVDATPFAAEWAVWATGKVKTWSMTVELNQDFDVGEIDDQLFPLLGELVVAAVRPKSGAVSSSNPQYQGEVIILSYPPFSNAVGELATSLVVLRGSGELTRVIV